MFWYILAPACIVAGILIYINILIASKFNAVAELKGHGKEVHAFAMCFWLGIIGYLYVISLPDLHLRNTTAIKESK
ncbi:MAG: hypothetical protein E7608_05150 [Ruminococcaceae bacterium]|nr:hypothetical protein [Oscillospiraceae bacterium]